MANRPTPPIEGLGELAVLHLRRLREEMSGAEFALFAAAREARIAEAGWTIVGVNCRFEEASGTIAQVECRYGEASEEAPIRVDFALAPPGQ